MSNLATILCGCFFIFIGVVFIKLKVLELFGGIGACSNALRNLGIDFEVVDYVEIDKYACKSYNAIYGAKVLKDN